MFPFTVRGDKTYNACTYDLSYVTKSRAWCSTKTDSRGNHVTGNVGVCDPTTCPIPPRGSFPNRYTVELGTY